jgi:hypothetical protein
MSWILVIIGIGLIAVGVDAGLLSRRPGHFPPLEIDRMVYGDVPPGLTPSAQALLEQRFVVKAGLSMRLIAFSMTAVGSLLVWVGAGIEF